MKSKINDYIPIGSRARRRKSIASESRERLFDSPLHTPPHTPLQDLGKLPQWVLCLYCQQTASTRVVRTDSKTTKNINTILWIGMLDPFALSSFDWAQHVDHFCSNCGGHLARKPYKGQLMVITEQDVAGLQLNDKQQLGRAIHIAGNQGARRNTDSILSVRRHDGVEADGLEEVQARDARLTSYEELAPEPYEASIVSYDQISVMTKDQQYELQELRAGSHLPRGESSAARS